MFYFQTILYLFLTQFLFIAITIPEKCVAESENRQVKLSAIPTTEETKSILRLGIHVSKFNTLDPHKAASTSDRILADMMYNGLIRFQPGNSEQMEPDLAVEIPDPVMIRGKQTWTFRLKKGILFHGDPDDGKSVKDRDASRELTARDVCRSFIKSSDPERSDYAGGYENISVTVIAPHTLRFTVDPPQSPLLFLPKVANYAGGFIVKEYMDTYGNPRFKGTGPFYFSKSPDEHHIQLLSHENYFRGKPALTGVDVRFIPDASLRLQAFLDHRLDVIVGEPDKAWLTQLKKIVHNGSAQYSPDVQTEHDSIPSAFALQHGATVQIQTNAAVKIDSFGVAETSNIYFNTTFTPFSDVRVRKAVALALDRDAFLVGFGDGLVQSVFSPVPPFMPGGLDAQEIKTLGLDYRKDLEKATQLMDEAGYGKGFDLHAAVSEVGSFYNNYKIMSEQLADIGITMRLQMTDHASMHRLIRRNYNPIVIYEAFRPNTDEYLSRFFHSSAAVGTGKNPATNFSHYSGIDSLIEQAGLERVTSRQIKLWEYAQIKLLEEMVVFPLFSKKQVFVRWNTVDYGHPLVSSTALYPQFTEKTTLTGAHVFSKEKEILENNIPSNEL